MNFGGLTGTPRDGSGVLPEKKRGICFLFLRGRDRKEKRGGKEWGREGETSEMGQGRADL